MAFDFSKQELKAGKTVPLVLDMLPGKPIVHLEWLGETNATWMSDQIARANAKTATAAKKADPKITKKGLDEIREKNRGFLAKHAVRRLEAKHNSGENAGKDATEADIPEFMAKIPGDVVDTIVEFCANQENFRDADIEPGDVKDLAGK